MIYQLSIRPPAQQDVAKAFEYYNDISPRLAVRFVSKLDKVFKLISRKPELFQKRYKNVRMALIDVFPFAIHFFIQNKTVVVIGCFHTSMSPSKWKQRLKP